MVGQTSGSSLQWTTYIYSQNTPGDRPPSSLVDMLWQKAEVDKNNIAVKDLVTLLFETMLYFHRESQYYAWFVRAKYFTNITIGFWSLFFCTTTAELSSCDRYVCPTKYYIYYLKKKRFFKHWSILTELTQSKIGCRTNTVFWMYFITWNFY